MNLYISNLSYNISDEDLRLLFADYGEITSAKVIMDRETGRSRGFGFVELSDDELAKKAIEELNQASYDGKVINITEARPREDRGDRGGRFNNNRGGGYGSNRGGGYGSNRGGGYGSNRDGRRY
ncbi:RNA-binding protein [Parabacteroides distasonis]|uniref:RNA recognition motif domain-containing protein n=2 Tax=Parabacteroides distasonis TaxID=823 RepID=UPI00147670CF|nr:RNA-binding protein [Parabacteroides distasonis]NME11672.1 RNA-binding protein [Parabacteroides distasonis]